MYHLFTLLRFPILSLALSSLFISALPAHAETQAKINNIDPQLTQIALTGKVKVSPQLEQQILEVIRRNPAVLLDVLKKYATEQQQKEQQLQTQELNKKLRASIGDSPTTGSRNRQVVLVEFSDFQCPYCAKADSIVKQFIAKHKDRVTLVYKHFPLTQIHAEALPAATASWAAHKQGKFWEYQEALFANQTTLSEPLYLETATKLKLDLTKFNADRKNAEPSMLDDFKLGRQVGVEGTPTFVMNGEVLTNLTTVADFEKALSRTINY